jgi:hypothetical protein
MATKGYLPVLYLSTPMNLVENMSLIVVLDTKDANMEAHESPSSGLGSCDRELSWCWYVRGPREASQQKRRTHRLQKQNLSQPSEEWCVI